MTHTVPPRANRGATRPEPDTLKGTAHHDTPPAAPTSREGSGDASRPPGQGSPASPPTPPAPAAVPTPDADHSSPDRPSPPTDLDDDVVQFIAIGPPYAVDHYRHELHHIGFAEANDWSKPLPGVSPDSIRIVNPRHVMRILTKPAPRRRPPDR